MWKDVYLWRIHLAVNAKIGLGTIQDPTLLEESVCRTLLEVVLNAIKKRLMAMARSIMNVSLGLFVNQWQITEALHVWLQITICVILLTALVALRAIMIHVNVVLRVIVQILYVVVPMVEVIPVVKATLVVVACVPNIVMAANGVRRVVQIFTAQLPVTEVYGCSDRARQRDRDRLPITQETDSPDGGLVQKVVIMTTVRSGQVKYISRLLFQGD
jgi:hypothetical protein